MGFQKGGKKITGNIFFMFRLLKLSPGMINLLHIKTIFCIPFVLFVLFQVGHFQAMRESVVMEKASRPR